MGLTQLKLFAVKPTHNEDINLESNPSFELGTTNFSAYHGAAIARSNTKQCRGTYALKVTPDGVTAYSGVARTYTLTANKDYYLGFDLWGVSGINYNLWVESDAGNLINDVYIGRDDWIRCGGTFKHATDTEYRVYISQVSASDGTTPFYVDGFLLMEDDTENTYFDGYSEDCHWYTTPHASFSYRSPYTRFGGEIINLSDYMTIDSFVGFGMSPFVNNKQPTAEGRSIYQNSNKVDREIIITGHINGGAYADLQTNRKALINLFKYDASPEDQPIILRYMGVDDLDNQMTDAVHIKCHLVDGLGGIWKIGEEYVTLSFEALDDPYLDGDVTDILGYYTTMLSINNILERTPTGVWKKIGTGANYDVSKVIYGADGYLYVGGSFTTFNGVSCPTRIVKVAPDGTTTAVGTQLITVIFDMILAVDGTLYIACNASGYYIYKWNGTNWVNAGTGLGTDKVLIRLAFDNAGYLYASGNSGVFKLSGGVWTQVGGLTGVGNVVFDQYDSIFAADGTSLYRFSGSGTWPVFATATYCKTLYHENGYIYMAPRGQTSSATAYISKINIATAEVVKTWKLEYPTSYPDISRIYKVENNLYFSGVFKTVDGISYPGYTFYLVNDVVYPIDIDFSDGDNVVDVCSINNNLVVGGKITGTAKIATVTAKTNYGTRVHPKFKISGTGSLWQIKNYINGDIIYFDGLTIQSGEVLTLDLEAGTFTSNYRGNMLSYINESISSLNWALEPGNNNISVLMNLTNGLVTMSYSTRFWSLDEALR